MKHTFGCVSWVVCAILGGVLFVAPARAADAPATATPAPAEAKTRTVAIFIKNRAKNVPDDKVTVLEDLVTSRITDAGFRVMSREDVVNAVAKFADAGPNAGKTNGPGADLDQILSNNTSALRLAQNMGGGDLLIASITTYGQDTTEYNEGDVHTRTTTSTMLISYKIIDGVVGRSLTGGVVKAEISDMEQPGQTVHRDLINKLLDQASGKLADGLTAKLTAGKIAAAPKDAGLAQFVIDCTMADLAIPQVVKNPAGDYEISANNYKVEAMACNVELDGIVLGNTPTPMKAAPGIHKIRITREGFKDYEKTIAIRDGLNLNIAMSLSGDGYARWRENTRFLENLKSKTKLDDADVKMIEGVAQMLRQSGYRVDTRSNLSGRDVKSVNVFPDMFDYGSYRGVRGYPIQGETGTATTQPHVNQGR